MSVTAAQPLPPRAAYTTDPVYRLTVEQYHEMIRDGVLGEDDPVELLEGVLVYQMPKKTPHTTGTLLSAKTVGSQLPEGWHYRSQEPITLDDGEPEPDGVVARGDIRDYLDRHPEPANLALAVEVADSSLERDRGVKLRSYARAGIQTYWILNLIDGVLEVYTDPRPDEAEPTYGSRQVLSPGESVALILDGREAGRVEVAALLP